MYSLTSKDIIKSKFQILLIYAGNTLVSQDDFRIEFLTPFLQGYHNINVKLKV